MTTPTTPGAVSRRAAAMSRLSVIAAWAIGAAATAGAVVLGVNAVVTAIVEEITIDRAVVVVVLVVFAVVVGLQVLAARHAGVQERFFDDEGTGSMVFGAVMLAGGVYVAVSMAAAGYRPITGAVFMCAFATAMCVRSATLASRSIRRGHAREPGEEAKPRKTP